MNLKKIKASILALVAALAVAAEPAKALDMGSLNLDRIRHTFIADDAEQIVHSGQGLLLAVIRSLSGSDEVTTVQIRDTSVANGAVGDNRQITPTLKLRGTAVSDSNPVAYPLPYRNGLSVDANSMDGSAEGVTVVYYPFN